MGTDIKLVMVSNMSVIFLDSHLTIFSGAFTLLDLSMVCALRLRLGLFWFVGNVTQIKKTLIVTTLIISIVVN